MLNFEYLGLKKLITTHCEKDSQSYALVIDKTSNKNGKGLLLPYNINLKGDGDFRSEESIAFLKEADIVVTNPPFSLFREYVAQLVEYDKKFLLWGNNNAITYKEIFKLIKENKLWLGYMGNKTCVFRVSDSYYYDKKLTDQELRNAVYAGPWLTSAKKRFSKTGCVASELSNNYVSANTIRQELLEKAISWIQNDKSDEAICRYMSKNQHELNSDELWEYFQKVINWVKMKFPNIRKELKSVEWGFLYNEYKDRKLDAKDLEEEIAKLMQDDEVVKKFGIYEYVLSRDEKHLNLRAFPNGMKREVYEAQEGVCSHCPKKFTLDKMEADHITPWSQGGKTVKENCQMLCKECNRRKSNK